MIRVLIVLAALCGVAHAHKASDAQVRIAFEHDAITGRIEIAVRDLATALPIDADGNGDVTWGEVVAMTPAIRDYVVDRVSFTGCPMQLGEAALVDLSDGAYWSVPITARCGAAISTAELHYALLFDVDAQHRGLVHLGSQTTIVRDATPVTIAPGEGTSIASFVREGIFHIWIGIDHILFLVCLLLPAVFPFRGAKPATSLRAVVKETLEIVTAFTLAHSITLIVSALGLVSLPSRVVESAIALSVFAVAFNNLVRAIDARWAVAFALGLLHGFGFSSVLLDLGLPSGELAGSLLGFNLGVEIGQLAIVCAVLPLLYAIRRTYAYRALLVGGSAVVAVVALIWTYQRWMA